MSTSEEIKAVEDRLEKRRELVAQRLADVKLEISSTASKAARSWPVFAVAGGLVAGYAISRVGRNNHHAVPAHGAIQYVPVHPAHAHPRMRTTSMMAALLGIAATALRIGASSEARMVLNAVRRFRDRRRHH
jgi:hypothetical protein